MSDLTKQIAELREPVAYGPVGSQKARDNAADTIERLQADLSRVTDRLLMRDAEIARLREALVAKDDAELDAYAQLVRVNGNMKTENDRLTAELETTRASEAEAIHQRDDYQKDNERLREALTNILNTSDSKGWAYRVAKKALKD